MVVFTDMPHFTGPLDKKKTYTGRYRGMLFPDILRMSGITDCNCLPGKELANSLPDKLKSMVYNASLPV
jgi:hypothetical protein